MRDQNSEKLYKSQNIKFIKDTLVIGSLVSLLFILANLSEPETFDFEGLVFVCFIVFGNVAVFSFVSSRKLNGDDANVKSMHWLIPLGIVSCATVLIIWRLSDEQRSFWDILLVALFFYIFCWIGFFKRCFKNIRKSAKRKSNNYEL